MDYTQIILGIIGVLTTIFLGLITKQLVPWLKSRHLLEAAQIAVHAAEAVYGRYHGSEKLGHALDSLKEKGFDINSNAVREAVEAAWKQLDEAMYASGEKYYDDEYEPENTDIK